MESSSPAEAPVASTSFPAEPSALAVPPVPKPRIVINYCTGCKWMMRAAWTAQELLTTFEKELGEVALAPGGAGIFRVSVEGPGIPLTVVWDRKEKGAHPEIKDLKQLVRDLVAPGKSLGHSDKPSASAAAAPAPVPATEGT